LSGVVDGLDLFCHEITEPRGVFIGGYRLDDVAVTAPVGCLKDLHDRPDIADCRRQPVNFQPS